MADDPVRKRLRRAAKRIERQRRRALAVQPTRTAPRGPGFPDLPPPEWPDDLDGGAGVREPRRPFPTTPAGALALDQPEPEYLQLVR